MLLSQEKYLENGTLLGNSQKGRRKMNLYQRAVDQIVRVYLRRFPGKYTYRKLRIDARKATKSSIFEKL